jgi:hypothetical protein
MRVSKPNSLRFGVVVLIKDLSMSELSIDQMERSHKNECSILKALSNISQVAVASRIGVHESTVCKLKDGDIKKFSAFLAACDLKVVPREYKCIDPKKAQAMVTLYEAAMSKVDTIELLWGDE